MISARRPLESQNVSRSEAGSGFIRAERDDLRILTQLPARVVHGLELENQHPQHTNTALKQQLTAYSGVADLASRRRTDRPERR
ncbi:hypothetical protein AB0B45_44760 [Nonomuraea sp. NPDC049152]|uniref:hypothetical protein n=1 Tax=Nonomuraea sp. NPDC049152 TaxID=3154350 RepID=UPI0033DB869A